MIAISYRREDSTPVAGRLQDRLSTEFGVENVFMDFDSIPYGVDFREHIKRTLERADVVVAVVGPAWLGRQGEVSRRIDDPSDFVRLEIAGALQRGIPVIPILVDNTPMPKPDALPAEIQGFAFRNALVLDTGIDFHHHADRLIARIRVLLKNATATPAITQAESAKKADPGTITATARPAARAPTANGPHRFDLNRKQIVMACGLVVFLVVCYLGIMLFGDRMWSNRAARSVSESTPAPSATATETATPLVAATRAPSPPSMESGSTSPAATAHSEAGFCSWMANDNGQFNSFFDQQKDAGSFPVLIEGRLHNGEREYRAIFVTKPFRQFNYYACWGYSPRKYEQYNSRLKGAGYDILSQQTFEDVVGSKIYQSVWVRSDHMPAAKECLKRTVR